MLILAYHRVQTVPSDTLSVSTRNFERQLRWLLLTGWTSAPIDATESNGRRFAVTFDDGYRDNHSYAAPILRRLGIPAAFFISTGYLDADKHFPWRANRMAADDEMGLPLQRAQVRELAEAGFEIGSHTVMHPHLTALADGEICSELEQSKRDLEDLSGRPCRFMAYPFGSMNRRVMDLAGSAGFSAAFVTPTRAGVPEGTFSRHRVGVYQHDNLVTFALKTSVCYRKGLRQAIWALRARITART